MKSIMQNLRGAVRKLGLDLAIETRPGCSLTIFYVYAPGTCTGERTSLGVVSDSELVQTAKAVLAEVLRLRESANKGIAA